MQRDVWLIFPDRSLKALSTGPALPATGSTIPACGRRHDLRNIALLQPEIVQGLRGKRIAQLHPRGGTPNISAAPRAPHRRQRWQRNTAAGLSSVIGRDDRHTNFPALKHRPSAARAFGIIRERAQRKIAPQHIKGSIFPLDDEAFPFGMPTLRFMHNMYPSGSGVFGYFHLMGSGWDRHVE